MGKTKKSGKGEQRHNPLYVDLEQPKSDLARPGVQRAKFAKRESRRSEKESETLVDPKASRKILEIARQQQEELVREQMEEEDDKTKYPDLVDREQDTGDSSQDEGEDEGLPDSDQEIDYDDEMKEWEIDESDAKILEKFMPDAPMGRQNLADIIMAKIQQHSEAQARKDQDKEAPRPVPTGLDAKIVASFTRIGHVLSRYKSGPVPKIFKILPTLANWKEVLYLTRPEEWTPHATYQATRLFVSNMKPVQAKKFLNLVVLDHVRNDIEENKKLNYHLYMTLKKALYKPSAFFKGILFPLCESGTCTLREAVIIGSVLSKVSVPALHSAAALSYLAQMDYTGPTSLFIRILLDKKYALPYKVVDNLVFHFLRFQSYESKLPVLWHQSFLVFVQRYKVDLTPEQKDALLGVLRKQSHPGISEEIRRELANSVCRGEMLVDPEIEMLPA